jgi:hypothetical protein
MPSGTCRDDQLHSFLGSHLDFRILLPPSGPDRYPATCEANPPSHPAGKYLDVYQFPDGKIEIRAAGTAGIWSPAPTARIAAGLPDDCCGPGSYWSASRP